MCVEPYRIAVRLLDGAADARVNGVPPPNLDATRSVTRPYPLLRIALGDREVAQRALKRRLTLVGRIEPCTLRIRDADLSAAHAALYWDGSALWGVDLLSRTGAWLDEQRVECMRIPAGRGLRLGEVRLTLTAPPARQHRAASGEIAAPAATANTSQRQVDALAEEKDSLQLQLLDAMRETARARDELAQAQQELRRERERRAGEDQARQTEQARHREEIARQRTDLAAAAAELRALREEVRLMRAELAVRRVEPADVDDVSASVVAESATTPAVRAAQSPAAPPALPPPLPDSSNAERPAVPTASGLDAFDCVLERLVERHRTGGWWHRLRHAVLRPFARRNASAQNGVAASRQYGPAPKE